MTTKFPVHDGIIVKSQAVLSHQASTIHDIVQWMHGLIGNPVPGNDNDRTFVNRIESFQLITYPQQHLVVAVVVVETEYVPKEDWA